MIRKLLIANRGEIAVRIIRTCRQMGITSVVVYADADAHSLAVDMADEAIAIGGNAPDESYLVIEKILGAAKRAQVDAIHPGFGFLAENADFAEQVQTAGFIFVGPSPASIAAMADKRVAKQTLKEVPFIPGYSGDQQEDAAFISAASDIGYPIMVKAAAGGGGKGMRLVGHPHELSTALASARREAQQAFGNGTLMLERALIQPRHIEVQIFGDQHGNVVAIGERECSIQRRHQKIVEETPSSALNPVQRQRLCDTAVGIAQQIGYYSAGTLEFLLDQRGDFYFMEMNTRLQVEHPVTELVYGVDLVRWQIRVAEGAALTALLTETPLTPNGHAIEVRIYAEDPAHQFLPVTGTIALFEPAAGVRTDTGVRTGDVVTPYYDPMIAKVIAHAPTRMEAIRKLDHALAETHLLGITTNLAYLRRILTASAHLEGRLSTAFVEEHADLLDVPAPVTSLILIAAALVHSPTDTYWRNMPNQPMHHSFEHHTTLHTVAIVRNTDHLIVTIADTAYVVNVIAADQHTMTLVVDGYRQKVSVALQANGMTHVATSTVSISLQWLDPLPLPAPATVAQGSLRAPMPGKVISVSVENGQVVAQGNLLMILEAMKMEHRIEAPYAGTVESVRYQAGEIVQAEEILLIISNDSIQNP